MLTCFKLLLVALPVEVIDLFKKKKQFSLKCVMLNVRTLPKVMTPSDVFCLSNSPTSKYIENTMMWGAPWLGA